MVPIDNRFKNLTVMIVKVTHRCNIDCLYCYENISGDRSSDMSIEAFKTIIDRSLANSKRPIVGFILHGGEPTLMPESWLEEALDYTTQQSIFYEKRIYLILQTNLISIADYHFRLAKKYNLRISCSLDGPVSLPESMRPRAEKAIENYRRFIDKDIQVSVLMTINQSNFRHFNQIMEWLEQDLELTSFQANVVSSVGKGFHVPTLTSEQILEAHNDILDHMILHKGRIIEHNLSEEILRFFATNEQRASFPKSNCHEKCCSAGSGVLSVTPEGNLLPCGRLPWNDSDHFMGSVHLKDENRFQAAAAKFQKLAPENWESCDECSAKQICAFGCQAFIVKSKEMINVECMPTKMRYKLYADKTDQLRPVLEAIRSRTEYGFARII